MLVELLVPLAAIFFVIGVPMIGLVLRYALRPLVNDVATAIRGGRDEQLQALDARLARLEERLESQDVQIERLLEAERFRRELEAGRAPRSEQLASSRL